ncbi:PITH domain-containing protein [Abeliophyllum distichum]|uniref:PITH domain-containing protein n=1 Tax=Abeliophyllum distichum TaxID=126358 RepID=A0ABD1UQK9_9LAMI
MICLLPYYSTQCVVLADSSLLCTALERENDRKNSLWRFSSHSAPDSHISLLIFPTTAACLLSQKIKPYSLKISIPPMLNKTFLSSVGETSWIHYQDSQCGYFMCSYLIIAVLLLESNEKVLLCLLRSVSWRVLSFHCFCSRLPVLALGGGTMVTCGGILKKPITVSTSSLIFKVSLEDSPFHSVSSGEVLASKKVHIWFIQGCEDVKSISIDGADTTSPAKMRVFINRDGFDFSDAQNMQLLLEDLEENLQGVLEYHTRLTSQPLGLEPYIVILDAVHFPFFIEVEWPAKKVDKAK